MHHSIVDSTPTSITVRPDVLGQTLQFMAIAFPDPQPKNIQTQMGVHFEEVSEMIACLEGRNNFAQSHINAALGALQSLADYMKNTVEPMIVVNAESREELLDALCDQLVTAAGVGYTHGMDVLGGLNEVNRSNFSKFVEGKPVHHPVTQKIMKGPDYSPVDLSPFV